MSRIWRCLLLLLAAICHLVIAQPAPTAVPTGVPTLIPSSLPTTQPDPGAVAVADSFADKQAKQATDAGSDSITDAAPQSKSDAALRSQGRGRSVELRRQGVGAFGGDPRFFAILLAAILFVLLLIWIIYKLISVLPRIHGCTNGFGEPTGLHHIYWGPGDGQKRSTFPARRRSCRPLREPPPPSAPLASAYTWRARFS